MSETTSDTDGESLRKRGNDLYQAGNFLEAIKLYEKAANKPESVDDPKPWSNLSAAYYESGKYEDSCEAARTALSKGENNENAFQQKLVARLAKARAHMIAQGCSDGSAVDVQTSPESSVFEIATYRILRLQQSSGKSSTWERIIDNISCFKPRLIEPDAEYGPIPNEDRQGTRSHKADFVDTSPIAKPIDLLFARIGDARNLYATWIGMCLDPSLTSPSNRDDKLVRMTVHDFRPHTFARNLAVWKLLEDIGCSQNAGERALLLHSLYYLFCGQLMPVYAWDVMQEKFEQVIAVLEGRSPESLQWLRVPAAHVQSIIVVLRNWQRRETLYTTEQVMKAVTASYFEDVKHEVLPNLDHHAIAENKYLQLELSIYRRTMALFPEPKFRKTAEPELQAAIDDFTSLDDAKGRRVIALRKYITAKWKVNPTWWDAEYERYESHVGAVKPTIENIPRDFFWFSLMEKPGRPQRYYDYMATFFSGVAGALQHLKHSMIVTIYLGDIAAMFERARWTSQKSESNVHAPLGFDRIHLSCLPDYKGLSLFSFLLASPLIKTHDAACVATSCTMTFGMWPSAEHYDCHGTALSSKLTLGKGLAVSHTGYLFEPLAEISALTSGRELIWYNQWRPIHNGDQGRNKLLSKSELHTWLYGLFLKLALPSNRRAIISATSPPLPYRFLAPSNLSVFLRLLIHLNTLGYPAHSLGEVLTNIPSDSLITNARPPETAALTVREVELWKTNQPQKFCTAPFFAEMSTLTSIFSRVLPFAIFVDNTILPSPTTIRKCTLRLPHLRFQESPWHLAIIFTSFAWKPPHGGWGTDTIRGVMLNHDYATKHKKDIMVITTWKYDSRTNTGTFWLREDEAKRIDPECWMCEVYSTESWQPIQKETAWTTYLDMQIGEAWTE